MSIITKLHLNRIEGLKVILTIVAVGLFILAGLSFAQQNRDSEDAVQSHTQTLNQINNVVIQLEKNNQVNHDTTIKYLECIVEGLINSTPSTAQATFNSCLAVSGLQATNQ